MGSSPHDPALPTGGEHLLRLLESKEGADVTFQVGQAEFAAHTLVLAARSPVFRAMLSAEQQKAPPPPQRRDDQSAVRRLVVRIDDTAPVGVRGVVYADALPPASRGEGRGGDGVAAVRAKGELLGAANRYGMERMRALCEDALREAVVDASAALVLADRHGCARLKPEVLREVVRTEGYAELKASHPAVVADILEQVAAGLARHGGGGGGGAQGQYCAAGKGCMPRKKSPLCSDSDDETEDDTSSE